MSNEYLVAVTMSGHQWIEAESEDEAMDIVGNNPIPILVNVGEIEDVDVLDVIEAEE